MSSTEIPAPVPTPPPDGWIDAKMTEIFGRSWRTKLAGFASMGCAVVATLGVTSPGLLPPNMVSVAMAMSAASTGLGLYHAKDANVSGPSTVGMSTVTSAQKPEPPSQAPTQAPTEPPTPPAP